MSQSKYSLTQEINDIASSIGSGLMARAGSNLSDHVFRSCVFLLAKEVAGQRRKAFERLSEEPKFADIPVDLFDHQHRHWVISLLFGSVMHPDFQPDVVAQYEQLARAIVTRAENVIINCPELFG